MFQLIKTDNPEFLKQDAELNRLHQIVLVAKEILFDGQLIESMEARHAKSMAGIRDRIKTNEAELAALRAVQP